MDGCRKYFEPMRGLTPAKRQVSRRFPLQSSENINRINPGELLNHKPVDAKEPVMKKKLIIIVALIFPVIAVAQDEPLAPVDYGDINSWLCHLNSMKCGFRKYNKMISTLIKPELTLSARYFTAWPFSVQAPIPCPLLQTKRFP